jgi:hypothetical protein
VEAGRDVALPSHHMSHKNIANLETQLVSAQLQIQLLTQAIQGKFDRSVIEATLAGSYWKTPHRRAQREVKISEPDSTRYGLLIRNENTDTFTLLAHGHGLDNSDVACTVQVNKLDLLQAVIDMRVAGA